MYSATLTAIKVCRFAPRAPLEVPWQTPWQWYWIITLQGTITLGGGHVSFQQNIGFARNHVFTSAHPFLVSLDSLFFARVFEDTHTHTNKRTYRFISFWWARLDFKNHQFVCIFGVEPNEGQHGKLQTPLLLGNSNFVCATKATYPSAMMHFKNCYLQDASLGKLKIEKKKADVMFPMTHPWDCYIHLHEWLIFYGECWYTYHTWIPY